MKTLKISLIGISLISAVIVAAKLIIKPKSKKKIVSVITKDTKDAMADLADTTDEVKRIILHGYRKISRELKMS
jgi:hypothetical protein